MIPGTLSRRRWLASALAGLAAVVLRGSVRPAAAQIDDPDAPPDSEPEPAGDPDATVTDATDEPDDTRAEPEFVPSGVPPAVLVIPKLGVEAQVVGVGQDADGAMDVPPDPDQVAWYTLGPGMGVPGNPVFAAHVDWNGRPRVFGRLQSLEPGDAILVIDEQGRGYEYAVEWTRWYRAEGAPVEDIFAQTLESEVTLITCGGAYNPAAREYLDRLVVRGRGL